MKLTYPDAEVLTYQYGSGGLVKSAAGAKGNFTYDYIKRLEYDKFEQRAFIVYGNNTRTTYTYNAQNRRLSNLKSGKGDGSLFQNLNYGYDNVGNILSLANNVPVPPPSQFGGPTTQSFGYDDLYRLTSASGTYQFSPDKTDRYTLSMVYDNIHNILLKGQNHEIVQASGAPITQKKTTYTWNYSFDSSKPHAPTHIGDRTFSYDANGNQLGWVHDQNGTKRTITWDEENRIQSIFDNGQEKAYKYNDTGERVIKRGPQGEMVYVNQYFVIRNKEIGTKHVYTGTTRVVSKLMKQDKPGANPQGQTPLEKDLYFYHPDHLGSSNYITDTNGKLYEHLEYFPFGETWVEESSNNTQRTPYLFTSKELDVETGLYYFGARYYDPRTSVWQSGDPILGKYLPIGNRGRGQELPGLGGIYNSSNLGVYSYSHLNPVRYFDPDGKATWPTKSNEMRTGGATGFVGYYGNSRVSGGQPKFHGGADILGKKGDPIYAFEGGKVIYAGDTGGDEGKMVTVEHTAVVNGKKETYRSNYMHLDRIDVKLNDKVKEGQVIGGLGNTGNASNLPESETHLHFQVKRGGSTVDPGSQFGAGDRVKQFFRGLFSGGHSMTIPETNYEKVRPQPKGNQE